MSPPPRRCTNTRFADLLQWACIDRPGGRPITTKQKSRLISAVEGLQVLLSLIVDAYSLIRKDLIREARVVGFISSLAAAP